MTLMEACLIAKECGLETVGEAIANVEIHSTSLFPYTKIKEEIQQLYGESEGIPDDCPVRDVISGAVCAAHDNGLSSDEEDTSFDDVLWNLLKQHRGHNVEIVSYGDWDDPASVTLECLDCGCVILDAELYTICVAESRA